MESAQLMETLRQYGADASGIQDRFAGDDELYQSCLQDFLDEPSFVALADALRANDLPRAFEAAHALKGCSGNLGLTPFYAVICPLVESLRAGNPVHLTEEYAAVTQQLQILKELVSGEEPQAALPPNPPPQPAAVQSARTAPSGKVTQRRFLIGSTAILLLATLCVILLFGHLYTKYNSTIDRESAEHLMEITQQVKLYIEDKIDTDWNIAVSVRDGIVLGDVQLSEETILQRMAMKCELWELSDVMLYTADGTVLFADGTVQTNDALPKQALLAQISGRALLASQSQMVYTLAAQTSLMVRGSEIVAVSVVQPMASLIEHMKLSLFGEEIWAYLTNLSGEILSSMAHPSIPDTTNLLPFLQEQRIITPQGVVPADELLSVRQASIYQLSGELASEYLVVTPIRGGTESFRLFCFAPLAVVNADQKRFAEQYAMLALVAMAIFTLFAFGVLHIAFRNRTKKFDEAVSVREHLFDLLVKNTHTAFGLLSANAPEPVFISENVRQVIGESFLTLEKTDTGMQMRGKTETETIRQINARMQQWHGNEPFRSGAIPNYRTAPPTFFELQFYPVDEQATLFVGIAQDVTQTHAHEEAVRNALAEAERSNAAKTEFLTRMSHNVRTPMNAIVNMTAFALENLHQPEKLQQQLTTIRDAAQQLMHLIQNVLDMGGIHSGKIACREEVFDLVAELEHLIATMRPQSECKHQTFQTDCSDIPTRMVCGDRLKLSHILTLLLGNAIKFTPEYGTVRLTVREIPSLREQMVDVRFVVEDTGMGISSAFLPHIFEPFSRADDQRVLQTEGSGLGLSICKSHVKAMGGSIQCESTEGEGSTFTVELFFQKAESEQPEQLPSLAEIGQPFLGKRCLVAEDNAINQAIVEVLLQRLGFTVEMVADGQACVRTFLPSEPGTYDMVYMDIQMPIMDGYQATIAIRASAHPQAKTIPIVAMTANMFAEDIEKARAVGMSGHLGKPITLARVVEETTKAIAFCAQQTQEQQTEESL